MSNETVYFWKRKLLAFLHDPPSKCLDIPTHETQAATLMRQAGFIEEEVNQYIKQADHVAASADRLPFPISQKCASPFDGVGHPFKHPLDGSKELRFEEPFVTAALAAEMDQAIQPVIGAFPDDWSEDEKWRARFFAHWRLFAKHAIERDWRFAFLPADTRIPDHTVWTHMQVTSALAGCAKSSEASLVPNKWEQLNPAFLKFQIGPVQEFIAQARSIRDLWSGSYLLSWLMAAGLKALSAKVGPDAVIYPNLREQPIFDLQWRDELWSKIKMAQGAKNVWESLDYKDDQLLTPNLPNVFLAVVPAEGAVELAKLVEAAIREEWEKIAKSVWKFCDAQPELLDNEGEHLKKELRKQRFDAQIARFLSISWQVLPWPENLEEAMNLAGDFEKIPKANQTPIQATAKRVNSIIKVSTGQPLNGIQPTHAVPPEDRDDRFYEDAQKTRLNNLGLGWAVMTAYTGWQLDAVRQTRAFEGWSQSGWSRGTSCNKDSLTGKEEAVAGGKTWQERWEKLGAPLAFRFKHDDFVGAVTLVKRLWDLAYLKANWGLTLPSMPDTRGIASHDPNGDGDKEGKEKGGNGDPEEIYFAVLALDGDQIGKWVSGEKTPTFKTQLSAEAVDYFQNNAPSLLDTQRPISPSYHLQFSEALSNFALRCVGPIVEVFDGRLIYAGGDDVVALLPADTALACAQALRMAFCGEAAIEDFLHQAAAAAPENEYGYKGLALNRSLLAAPRSGFLCRKDMVDQKEKPIPFVVPGPAAECSVGIAIAHYKSPLQDAVCAAQEAERRAKKADLKKGGLGRSAVAVTLVKRSGEIIEWGCKWESGGLELFQTLLNALLKDTLSAKFPHRIIEVLEPYLTRKSELIKNKNTEEDSGFKANADKIIQREFEIALGRQKGKNWDKAIIQEVLPKLDHYLQQLRQLGHADSAEARVSAVIGLCQTVAFAARTTTQPQNPQADRQEYEHAHP